MSNWISGAIKHPGALHKQLGVKEGQKIPASKLHEAAKKKTKGGDDTKLAKRARLALTLKSMHHGMQMGPGGFGLSHGITGEEDQPEHEFRGHGTKP